MIDEIYDMCNPSQPLGSTMLPDQPPNGHGFDTHSVTTGLDRHPINAGVLSNNFGHCNLNNDCMKIDTICDVLLNSSFCECISYFIKLFLNSI